MYIACRRRCKEYIISGIKKQYTRGVASDNSKGKTTRVVSRIGPLMKPKVIGQTENRLMGMEDGGSRQGLEYLRGEETEKPISEGIRNYSYKLSDSSGLFILLISDLIELAFFGKRVLFL
ncbi:hypothetical protein KQX54_002736 [Cotesia glomerata]|uniref:Uncharacterized protein n=1 Tax=Cotesia glomerata TaxID=32391 RepID=A0AAV7IFJ3_COTGL|nr:hypothetical protein KQX54_002736 [Cotesia glomerata]